MIRKTIALFSLGLVVLASSSAQAFSPAVATFSPSPPPSVGANNQTLGFDFTANTQIVVSALGLFDSGNNLVSGQVVNLYDVTKSVLVASQAITPISGGSFVNNDFNYTNLAGGNIILNAGDVYSVYSVYTTDNFGQGTITLASGLSNVTPTGASNGNQGLYGTGNVPPTAGSFAIISTSFQFSPLSSVPEPASIAMMGLGLAGVVLVRRKMAKRSA